jgi:16S rRNA (guanine527-N7)-methyltransferase
VSDWRRLREDSWRPLLAAHGVAAGLLTPLARYLDLLARFESAVDLVGRVGPETLITDHVLDSLAAAPLLPESGVVVDVGSGNGFPAVPLLLARPGLRGVLLEPRERRWAFLRTAVRELGLAAEVRRERLGEHRGRGYDALTVRALGIEAWKALAGSVLRDGGVALWWTTARGAAAAAPAGMARVLDSPLPVPERGVIAVWRRCST